MPILHRVSTQDGSGQIEWKEFEAAARPQQIMDFLQSPQVFSKVATRIYPDLLSSLSLVGHRCGRKERRWITVIDGAQTQARLQDLI